MGRALTPSASGEWFRTDETWTAGIETSDSVGRNEYIMRPLSAGTLDRSLQVTTKGLLIARQNEDTVTRLMQTVRLLSTHGDVT